MKPSLIASALETCYELRRPAFLWGPPGVGKSEIVEQAADRLNLNLIDFRMALRDPTDIKGFPMPDAKSGTMKFYRDSELPTKGKGILFMDELNGCAPATQAAGMQLTLTGRIGDYQLPAGWCVMAAGNRESDRGVAQRMPTPLANRFTHIEYDLNTDDWVHWAQDPKNDIAPELIAFMRFRPALLSNFEPGKTNSNAFATPRSWVAADKLRRACKDKSIIYDLIKGTVGEGPGTEYWSFLKTAADLPSIDEIKMNPDGAPVPSGPAGQYAVCTALAMSTTDAGFDRFMIYVHRLPTEYQAVYVRDCLRKEPKIKTNSTFQKWAVKNEKVIM